MDHLYGLNLRIHRGQPESFHIREYNSVHILVYLTQWQLCNCFNTVTATDTKDLNLVSSKQM